MLSELSSSEATFDNFLLRNLSACGFLSLKANVIYSSSSLLFAKYSFFFHNYIFFIIISIYTYKSQQPSRKFFSTGTNHLSYREHPSVCHGAKTEPTMTIQYFPFFNQKFFTKKIKNMIIGNNV